VYITSAQNGRIKLVKRLRSKRARTQERRFLIDYQRDLARALRCGYEIDFLLHCPELSAWQPPAAEVHTLPRRLMQRISYRENASGIVAVMHSRPPRELAQLLLAQMEAVLVLAGLQVPGNIGALLRSADAAGVDAIILADCALDRYNPNIIRSSTGACFLGNVVYASGVAARRALQESGFRIYGCDVRGQVSLFAADFGGKCALVLGSEDSGLGAGWRSWADALLRIPMTGTVVDSLNVSVSGALCMFALRRHKLSQVQG